MDPAYRLLANTGVLASGSASPTLRCHGCPSRTAARGRLCPTAIASSGVESIHVVARSLTDQQRDRPARHARSRSRARSRCPIRRVEPEAADLSSSRFVAGAARPFRQRTLARLQQAPTAAPAGNQGSEPIGRGGPTADCPAGLASGEYEVRGHGRVETRLLIRTAGVKWSVPGDRAWGSVGVLGPALRAGARAYFGPRPSGWFRGRRRDV